MTSRDPFRILALCTGNICRSPAMEALLASQLRSDRLFSVESAGTEAMTGWGADPAMVRLLRREGMDIQAHRARQADAPMLRRADLILTATFAHREWATHLEPAAARRSFTLSEFAEIVTAAPSGLAPRELTAWAAAHRPAQASARARSTRRGGAPGDIIDPYGRGDTVFRQSLAQLTPLTTTIAEALTRRD